MPSHRSIGLPVFAAALALVLAACTPAPSDGPRITPVPSPTATPGPNPDAEEPGAGLEDAFAERDRFFAAQEQVPDGSLLVAKTPAQMELIAAQRAYAESQGAVWDETAESITLALSLDACETSILNGHAVDTDVFRMHVGSSPLIAAIAGGDPQVVEGAVQVMVFGTRYLCPDDAEQWENAWREAAGTS